MSGYGWKVAGGVASVVAIIGTVAILAIGGYGLYWWLARDTAQRRYETNTQTQQYQAGLISQERNLSLDWGKAIDPGQKQAIADQFCQVYPNLNPAPADLTVAHSSICN